MVDSLFDFAFTDQELVKNILTSSWLYFYNWFFYQSNFKLTLFFFMIFRFGCVLFLKYYA